MTVYLVEAVGADRVKIGHARDADARIAKMRVDCPFDLTILARFVGARDVEMKLHARFAKHRIRGEWYWRQPAMTDGQLVREGYEPELPKKRVGRTPLEQYLIDNDLTMERFGALIGTTHVAVHRYIQKGRVPGPNVMQRIIKATNGRITPNDFFSVPGPAA